MMKLGLTFWPLLSQIYFSSEIICHILGIYYPVDAHSCNLVHFAHELYGRFHAFFAQSIIMFPIT